MGRRFLVVAAVLAMTLGIGAWGGETASSGSRAPKAKTVRVDAKRTSFKPGTTTTETSDYFQGGKKVGSDQVACVLTGPGLLAVCTATHLLPKGELISAGSVTPGNQAQTIAIVGGTGSYTAAGGTIDLNQTSATETTVTFHITG